MKLLLDMNLSERWVPALRAAGHSVMHWREIGDRCASDAEIMAFASGWVRGAHP